MALYSLTPSGSMSDTSSCAAGAWGAGSSQRRFASEVSRNSLQPTWLQPRDSANITTLRTSDHSPGVDFFAARRSRDSATCPTVFRLHASRDRGVAPRTTACLRPLPFQPRRRWAPGSSVSGRARSPWSSCRQRALQSVCSCALHFERVLAACAVAAARAAVAGVRKASVLPFCF
jgi:hypothetical protein